ncbi:MAG: DUF6737 family protein [Cyanobacteria bacterium J06554_11]
MATEETPAKETPAKETPAKETSTEETSTNIQNLPESMWQIKPWWCQPWSIVLTGLAISFASWLVLHRLWITLPIVGVIGIWWWLFLWLVPTQYAAAIREGIDAES